MIGRRTRRSRGQVLAVLARLALGALGAPATLAVAEEPPRLVLQITVDGLRADLLSRGADRFGAGGLRDLLERGAVFGNAHYRHANTETIVGHATLATGAQPSAHGMTGNVWYDAATGELAYNIEDPDHPLLPVRETQRVGEQVDPAQRLARTDGRSPRALLSETVADKLLSYTGGRTRVFSVSGKDRGAVPMAGRGMAEAPEYMAERGFDAGRLTPDVIVAAVERNAAERFDLDGVVRFYHRPFVYLDDERIAAAGLDPAVVHETLAEGLTDEAGVHLAVTRRGLAGRGESALLTRIRNNFHATRAGDLYVVQEPYWFNFEAGPVVVMHGSPWSYDTHVPVIFAGPGIAAGRHHRPVQPADVAPTLAALLGMSPPASAQGTVLPEVVDRTP